MQIVIEEFNGLEGKSWRFWVDNSTNRLTIKLDAYSEMKRQTFRHSWKVTKAYRRIAHEVREVRRHGAEVMARPPVLGAGLQQTVLERIQEAIVWEKSDDGL